VKYKCRVLGHEGQVLIQNITTTQPLRELVVPLPQKLTAFKDIDWDNPIEVAPKRALAHYERTDGGGTRIYRLKVNL